MVDVGALADGLQAEAGEAAKRVTTVLPLWVLILIVIVGTGLIALGVGFCCLCACRGRRRGNSSGKVVLLNNNGVSDRASDGGGDGSISHDDEIGVGMVRGRGRLRKPRPSTLTTAGYHYYDDDDDDEGEGEIGFREISPVRKVSMLVMPDFFGRRGSLNPFAGGGGGGGFLGGNNNNNNVRCGSGGGGGVYGLPRRMSNAWVDEDTLHGPKMTSTKPVDAPGGGGGSSSRKTTKKSWRKSLRESWPLKTLSPTLPMVPQFEGIEEQVEGGGGDCVRDSFTMFHYKDYYQGHVPELLPPPPGLVARPHDGQGSSPPRPLPKPPKQALLAAAAAANNNNNRASSVVGNRAGGWTGARSIGEVVPSYRGLSYYKYEETDEPVRSTNSLRTKPGGGVEVETDATATRPRGGGRLSSAGSTLSVILKDTEMRLQEGTASGVARRNRLSTSPPKRTAVAAAAAAAAGPDGSTATLVGSAPRTPSPPKTTTRPLSGSAGAASAHTRQTSDASVLSEADSMVGDGSPGLLYHGLTSPSRSKPQQQQQQPQQQLSPHRRKLSRAASFTSSIASSLSDISEENSMVSGMTPNTTAPNSSIPADMNKIAGHERDPFMATGDTVPAGNSAGPCNRGVYPASRGAHGTLERQRGRQTSDETLFTIAQSPLSLISGNSRSPEPSPTRMPERANKTKAPPQSQQRNQPAAVHLPAPDSWDSPSDDIHKRTSPGKSTPTRMANIPNLSLTSPSTDGDSPTPKRLGVLRQLESPPLLVHGYQSRDREESPDMVPPSPALANNSRLSSVYDCYAQMPSDPSYTSTSATRRRAAGEVRKISEDTTASSSYYSDQETYEREKMAALDELNVLLNQDIRTGQPRTTATATANATVRMVPPEWSTISSNNSNNNNNNRALEVSSTVAELRRMNSQISAAASGYSDDSTATVRPEVVSPPRKGAAARNYLALGSPPKNSSSSSSNPRVQQDKENNGRNGGLKRPKVVVDDNGTTRPGVTLGTPVRNRRNERVKVQGVVKEEGSRSEESLGLYDEDGFLISPERRLGLRT
ncbi:hypothetical protein VMCG_10259 [Cytospora schulzeri]|uniref:Uncharacterized protein n=1 Tax=Cytospora schulzeri TaxID=448051 RepID=A0A423VGR5_9PEZI|nr:hypothetical protein VMCG_10259 [Valsa malicola]